MAQIAPGVEKSRVAALSEHEVARGLIAIGCSLIAIGRGLIAVSAGLVGVRDRLIPVGESLILLDRLQGRGEPLALAP